MSAAVEIRIDGGRYEELHGHLFQRDHDEHGAILLCGLRESSRGRTFLVREVHLLRRDEFVPGSHGYRQVTPAALADWSLRADREGWALLTAHSHPGALTRVGLSGDDREGHTRVFPYLLDMTSGNPVGGIVFGEQSAAGEIWTREGISELGCVSVVGPALLRLTPDRHDEHGELSARFDRQARLFGSAGQRILQDLRIGVIGAGGGGSMLVEQLAHLGVGELVVADFDAVQTHNLSRIVGARRIDARLHRKKITVLKRLVRRIDPSVSFTGIDGDLTELRVAEALRDVDFLFLATDTTSSRLVFNALVHRYLIPGIQIGAKVEVAPASGEVTTLHVVAREVWPTEGCLQCAGLVDPQRLQQEAQSAGERRAQNYLNEPEVIDPSVISLNGIGASHAVTRMLFYATGLTARQTPQHRLWFPLEGDSFLAQLRSAPGCPACSNSKSSWFAKGDPSDGLPCRPARDVPSRWGSRLSVAPTWISRLRRS